MLLAPASTVPYDETPAPALMSTVALGVRLISGG